jgi:hypothetical protein
MAYPALDYFHLQRSIEIDRQKNFQNKSKKIPKRPLLHTKKEFWEKLADHLPALASQQRPSTTCAHPPSKLAVVAH